jgi:hypothetical protein
MNVPAKAAVDDATSEALARIVAAVPEVMAALGLALPPGRRRRPAPYPQPAM